MGNGSGPRRADTSNRYHKPGDEFDASSDLSGALDNLGLRPVSPDSSGLITIVDDFPATFLRRTHMADPTRLSELGQVVFDSVRGDSDSRRQSPASEPGILT